jgi:hypothetical protein
MSESGHISIEQQLKIAKQIIKEQHGLLGYFFWHYKDIPLHILEKLEEPGKKAWKFGLLDDKTPFLPNKLPNTLIIKCPKCDTPFGEDIYECKNCGYGEPSPYEVDDV